MDECEKDPLFEVADDVAHGQAENTTHCSFNHRDQCRVVSTRQGVHMNNDFNYAILSETAHRPWAMPDSPWILTQSWHDLLFVHWSIDVAALRPLVPAAFELDLFEAQAWVAVVPFQMSNVSPRAVPALPWISAFPELNVRTYVRMNGRGGVYFFSLDATNPVAVAIARTLVHLPYFTAAMKVQEQEGWIEYRSRRSSGSAQFAGR